jgi:hypothetical protein
MQIPLLMFPSQTLSLRGQAKEEEIGVCVLFVGEDDRVWRVRPRSGLDSSHFQVRSIDPDAAECVCLSSASSFWIFGTGIEPEKLIYLASSVRRWSPNSRLLRLKISPEPDAADCLFHCLIDRGIASERIQQAIVSLLTEVQQESDAAGRVHC